MKTLFVSLIAGLCGFLIGAAGHWFNDWLDDRKTKRTKP